MNRTPAVLVGLATAIAGCTATPAPPQPPPSAASAPGSPAATAAPAPSGPATATPTSSTPAASPDEPSARDCAALLVAGMSLRERAGQTVMAGVRTGSAAEVAVLRTNRIGSVIIMGEHPGGVAAVKRLTSNLDYRGRAAPVLVAVDQEGGAVRRLSGPGFDAMPSAATQATWSTADLRRRATGWGRQLRAAGVHWTLAPVADVVPDELGTANAPIGALRRGYGSDPDTVSAKVTAVVEGMVAAGVATSAKHFPGIGRVRGNTDLTAGVTDTRTTADDPYLQPFAAAVRAGVPSIMISTVVYRRIDPDAPAVYSSAVLRVLRDRLGFDGVAISDDLGVAAAVRSVPVRQRAIRFLRAGGDLAITAVSYYADEFVEGVLQAARSDEDDAATVTRAATRVVTLKVQQGLIDC